METEAQGTLLEAEATTKQETTSQWYPDEYEDVVKRAGWQGPADAVKSYRELEKSASGKVKLPVEGQSSAEEIRAFYEKTGCPKTPDGYTVNIPEEVSHLRDEPMETVMKEIAYKKGVSEQAFDAIVGNYYKAMADRAVQEAQQAKLELKQELGDKYEEGVEIAQRFVGTCSKEFQELMEQTGMGRHPVFIKEFIAKGKQTMADTLIKGEQTANTDKEYKPANINSPEMYEYGDDEESVKARKYFSDRGHVY